MLTRKQHELLMFIHERMKESGIPPSFDEMKDALDLASKSGIHRLITALEERGFIRRLPNRARALEVVKLPDSMNPSLGGRKVRFEPAVIEGNLGKVASPPSRISATEDYVRPVSIPVMGRIAAGTPIEAIQSHSHTIAVPPEMLGPGEHYALEVRGDSMIDAGIFDGDLIAVRKSETARSGEIVVARIGEEVTVKTLRLNKSDATLLPANEDYEPIQVPADQLIIEGVFVGLIRDPNAH